MSHKKSQESLKNFISNIIGLKYLDRVPRKNLGGGSTFNFKVHGLLVCTSGTTSSHPDPAQCTGPEFKE